MKKEQIVSFATGSALSIGLMLALASPGFAGISLSINPTATFVPGNNKQVIVTGTVTCPSGKVITVGIQMVQQGKMAAHAWGETRGVQCNTGTVSTWEITASSPVPMQGGPASALAGAWACFPSEPKPTGPCEFSQYSGDISLK
ncbi:MAG TPA: hypothetical protein VIE66_10335 [Methylocella sp.]|jgi:hypothetical protein